MEKEVVGRSFASDIVAEKNADGDWVVLARMIEKRKLLGGEWEEKVIQTQCTDKDYQSAYSVAMQATFEKFESETVDHSLFFEVKE